MVYKPTSTYRLQLSKDFNLDQVQAILPYLKKLGISTIYASPLFSARKGSTHGYDVTGPGRVNDEIGSEDQLADIFAKLKELNIGWLQDIVPNHMAYSPENSWMMDVLEKGPFSQWYSYFDFWNELNDELNPTPVMTPFLGSPLDECLKNKEIRLISEAGHCYFDYFGSRYPLSLPSYLYLLNGSADPGLQDSLSSLVSLLQDYSHSGAELFYKQLKEAENELQLHCSDFEQDISSLKVLLEKQYYRLCWWKDTEKEINYRRFFTVNDLICLNIQKPEVFNTYHEFIAKQLKAGNFQGVRVDHVDGLYDPKKYLENLRYTAGDDAYLLVEKILESSERIDSEWPIQGTTGYDFLALVNALFVYPDSQEIFSSIYQEFAGDLEQWDDLVWNCKELILHQRMQGEFKNLFGLFYKLDLNTGGYPKAVVKEALSTLLLSFPVYRTYINRFPISDTDTEVLKRTFNKASRRISENAKPALQQLESILNGDESPDKKEACLLFIQRVQQISGPLEAKGLEDTTFYSYNRLISLNEVGCHPYNFGLEISDFHKSMQQRQEQIPLTLNCTATHDTKRGEDARQRLNALSEIPGKWKKAVEEWNQLNREKKKRLEGGEAPDKNDEYFIYQSLLAFYPANGRHDQSFHERIKAYMEKALRESKRNTSWSEPDIEYERASLDFISSLLKDEEFLNLFRPLALEITHIGMLKSISQLTLKMFAPGIPDVYQGTELPDLSMVDPDNRRPVDYIKREEWLDNLHQAESGEQEQLFQKMMEHLTDGRMKLYLTHKFLHLRKDHPDIFLEGQYLPLKVQGRQSNKIIAFARVLEGKACLIVAPLFPALIGEDSPILDRSNWDDTEITLPPDLQISWTDIFTNKPVDALNSGSLPLYNVLNQLPVAVLKGGMN